MARCVWQATQWLISSVVKCGWRRIDGLGRTPGDVTALSTNSQRHGGPMANHRRAWLANGRPLPCVSSQWETPPCVSSQWKTPAVCGSPMGGPACVARQWSGALSDVWTCSGTVSAPYRHSRCWVAGRWTLRQAWRTVGGAELVVRRGCEDSPRVVAAPGVRRGVVEVVMPPPSLLVATQPNLSCLSSWLPDIEHQQWVREVSQSCDERLGHVGM